MNWIFCLIFIILVCITGLVWYFMHLIAQSYSANYKDEIDYLRSQFEVLMGQDASRTSYIQSVEPSYMSGIVDSIESSIVGIQFAQMVYIILLVIIAFVVYIIWFVEYPFSYILNVIFGAIVVSLFSFYATSTIGKAMTRTIIFSTNNKEECFSYMYNAGFALCSLLISLVFGVYILMYYFNVAVWGGEMDKEGMEKVSVLMMGFLMGMLLSAFVYREATSMMCRAFKTATFGLIKSDLNLNVSYAHISQLTRQLYMVSQQAGQIAINFIDSSLVMTFIVCTGTFLFVHSGEVLDNDNKHAHILAPVFWYCVTYVALMLCFCLKTAFQDNETGSFAALNIRWQVIIASVMSFIILATIPYSSIVDKFTLKGDGTDIIDLEGKNNIAACWCCILGLVGNVLHISIYEWYTSHGCPNVRNMALASSDRILSMNMIYHSYLGDLFASVPLLFFFAIVLICYQILGFAGLLFAGCGYFSLFLMYGIVYFIGATASDSYKLTCFAYFTNQVQGKIFQIYWETKNYMIFLKVTNSGATILTCMAALGALLYDTASIDTVFKSGYSIFGFLVGAALIYILKGLNTWGIINIAKNYFIIPPDEPRLNYQSDIRVLEYTKQKFTRSIAYVGYNLLTVLLTVFISGSFFGKDATIGLLTGSLVLAMLIQFQGLIKGTTLENSRIYNEIQEERKDKMYMMYVSGDQYGYATEETNATPLLVYVIFIFCLVCSSHKRLNHAALFAKE